MDPLGDRAAFEHLLLVLNYSIPWFLAGPTAHAEPESLVLKTNQRIEAKLVVEPCANYELTIDPAVLHQSNFDC